jgi:hypothetical protein
MLISTILFGIYALWMRYQVEPVTRDGKVRADPRAGGARCCGAGDTGGDWRQSKRAQGAGPVRHRPAAI